MTTHRAAVIRLTDVTKAYPTASGPFTAIDHLDLAIDEGEFVAVVGRSGSGKTTLLNLLAGIDRPTSGGIQVAGAELARMSEDRLAAWRGRNVGLVFQFFQLLPTLTVIENVMLPMDFANTIATDRRRGRAAALLDRLGVADQANKLPAALSGGQQQRAAIARGLALHGDVLLADEVTSELDAANRQRVIKLLRSEAKRGAAVVFATHDPEAAAACDRELHLVDGVATLVR
jgi:putative ABC transport system ATP-binding protein